MLRVKSDSMEMYGVVYSYYDIIMIFYILGVMPVMK